jgi:quinol monooxygenase YgiN
LDGVFAVTMRAVWSFWSKPFERGYWRLWGSAENHLLAWVISVNAASRHYPDTMLVTDARGKALLVDRLGLRFAQVSTALERLERCNAGLWMAGKLVAYGLQSAPFVHLDSDVFLWRALPSALERAPVVAQHPERYADGKAVHSPESLEASFAAAGGVLPDEWRWARSQGPITHAANCGILGGQRADFLRHYARTALALIEAPGNAAAWARIPDKWHHNYLIEQFLLAAMLDYHRYHPASPFRGVHPRYLFESWEEALDSESARARGFTHLMAGAKRAPSVMQRISRRVERDWPDYRRRCAALAEAA